jgi:hypothetical protein
VNRGDKRCTIEHPVLAHAVRGVEPRFGLQIVGKARIRDLDDEQRVAAPQVRCLNGSGTNENVEYHIGVFSEVELRFRHHEDTLRCHPGKAECERFANDLVAAPFR